MTRPLTAMQATITDSSPLWDQTAKSGFTLKEVSADKAYLGSSNILTSLQHGAIPYIPFKSNQSPRPAAPAQSRKSGRECFTFIVTIVRSSTALSQTLERRDNLSYDQVEVWSTTEK